MTHKQFKFKMDKLDKREAAIAAQKRALEEEFMDAHGVPKVGDVEADEHGIIKIKVQGRELLSPKRNWDEMTFVVHLGGNPVYRNKVDHSTKTGIIHTFKTF